GNWVETLPEGSSNFGSSKNDESTEATGQYSVTSDSETKNGVTTEHRLETSDATGTFSWDAKTTNKQTKNWVTEVDIYENGYNTGYSVTYDWETNFETTDQGGGSFTSNASDEFELLADGSTKSVSTFER